MAFKFIDFLSVDYTKTKDGQLAKNAKKRKKDSGEGTTEETNKCNCESNRPCEGKCGGNCDCGPDCAIVSEALTMALRRAKSRVMKKYKARLALGRKKAAVNAPNAKVVARRARKAARNAIAKKLTKGINKADLTPARKAEIEKRLDKMAPRVTRLAKKLTPGIRQAALARRK